MKITRQKPGPVQYQHTHYGLLNFAYGTSPFLRMAELVFAFNNELVKKNHARLSFIMPLIYDQKQAKIIFSAQFVNTMPFVVRDLTIIKIPFMMSSNFKIGGIEDEDIDTD